MTVLTRAQHERGITLAQRERSTRWDWGDWALDVAGPVGERGNSDDSYRVLAQALDELASNGDVTVSEMPSVDSLRHYRAAADAIPPKMRKFVPTVYAGHRLASITDRRERHELIERLADEHPKGIITVDAARRALDVQPTRPTFGEQLARPERNVPEHHQGKVELARELLQDKTVVQDVIAETTPASLAVEREVTRQRRERRERRAENLGQLDEQTALPLPAYVAKVVGKLSEWAGELQHLRGHLDQLTDDEQRNWVADRHNYLINEAVRNVELLVEQELPDDDVIEGNVVEIR